MPSLDFERADDSATPISFDDLQRGIGSSDVSFDQEPIVRKEAASNEQGVRAVTDTLWAGSATINEEYELERHIKEFVEEGRVFPSINKALIAYGYSKDKIRRVFQKVTGIDPVQAYIDVSTYTIPPDAVPRYNYGWGPSKDKKADYYFILPFISKYAIYQQTGLDREIVYENFVLSATREELKSYVKDVRAVSMDSLDNDSDIIQRVASIQAPEFETEAARHLSAEVSRLKTLGEGDLALKMAKYAFAEDQITRVEFDQLSRQIQAADPSEMTNEDIQYKRELDKYQRSQEGRTVEDEVTNVKIPQESFKEKLEDVNYVDMKQLSSDAYDLLTEIAKTVPGFEIEPLSQTVDLINVESLSTDESDHINTGSIRFVVQVSDYKTQTEKKALVIMFIVNGKLQYTGKFKGEDNREYALSSPGINAYFDASEGKSIEDMHYSPQAVPGQENSGPYR